MSIHSQNKGLLRPPGTWPDARRHARAALTHPWYRTLLQLQAAFVSATFEFFRGRSFAPALMPITCSAVSSPMAPGSDSLPVHVELHGECTYLADSMQFHLEYLLRHGGAGVFYIMPTFRGEDPDESHLNEFFHSEAELRGDFDDVVALVSDYLHHCAAAVLSACRDGVSDAAGTVDHLERLLAQNRCYARVDFQTARRVLGDDPRFVVHNDGGRSVTRAGEFRLLSEFGSPLWLTNPDRRSVPFYQAWGVEESAKCADLLLEGVGEVVGCGERHPDASRTLAAMAEQRVSPEPYEPYLNMKRDHPMVTSGFGLGLERFLLWVLDHDDIRDLQVFPRLKGARSW